MIWYFENLLRHRTERLSLEELASKVDWLVPRRWKIDSSARLAWDIDIIVGDRVFEATLCYPNHFPYSPPLVLPRDEKSRWSSHQWGAGGELCLEWGPDNWHPDITGADMLESAQRLLLGERPEGGEAGNVPSRHDMTIGQTLRTQYFYLLVTNEFSEAIASIPEGTFLQATAIALLHAESYIYIVTSFVGADGSTWTDPGPPTPLKLENFDREVALCRLPADVAMPKSGTVSDFNAALADVGMPLPPATCVILVKGDVIAAFYLNEDKDEARRVSIIPPRKHVDRLDHGHKALVERKVGIVGCGSVGSKIAAMLARAGVGNFLLVDDDILFSDNLVRHDLDWREVGTHKVDSVARRIKLINPDAKCEVRRHRLGGQEASGSVESLIEKLSECDLVIDATADPRVFNYLCASVAVGKKPLIWAEVYGGGIGGLVARHRPLLEPSPAKMRQIIEAWCAGKGKTRQSPAGRYETREENGPPLIADDADVSVIAAHAARFAVDVLIPRRPSAFPNSVYMIGLAEGWFFEQPFHVEPIEVGEPEDEPSEELDASIQAEERDHIIELLKSLANANSADNADSQPS